MRLGPVLLVAAGLAGSMAGQPRPRSEEVVTLRDVELLDCAPVSTRPCFRATLRFGSAAPVTVGMLMSNAAVDFDGLPAKLFYVSSQEHQGSRKPRTVMFLLDISGSMRAKMSNGVSRYDVAIQAVDRFVAGLDPELDRVAVVPFDNHSVVSTIRSTRFVPGGEEARGLLAGIPQPRGDTALYAAIYHSLDVLEQQRRADGSRECQLIVITDGKDDLGPNPDPDLRQAPISLDTVALKAERSSVTLYPIGIGGASDTDILAPLERISIRNSHMVQEPEELSEILAQARPALMTQARLTFLSPYATAGQLEGRNHRVRVVIGKGGDRVEAATVWAPAESMIAPVARADCAAAEKQALSRAGAPADNQTALIRPLGTLAVFAGILALCWFAMPRLIWPERYGAPAAQVERVPPPGRAGADPRPAAPPGNARHETEKTYVLPRDHGDTRSRFR